VQLQQQLAAFQQLLHWLAQHPDQASYLRHYMQQQPAFVQFVAQFEVAQRQQMQQQPVVPHGAATIPEASDTI
jgi:hypothetical protein